MANVGDVDSAGFLGLPLEAWIPLGGAAASLIAAIVLARRGDGRRTAPAFAVIVAIACIAVAGAATMAERLVGESRRASAASLRDVEARLPSIRREDGYVGAAACAECHREQHGTWDKSHHRRMTTAAHPLTTEIKAPFDGSEVTRRGRSYRFTKDGDGYFVEMVDPAYEWRERGGERDATRDADDPPPRVKKRIVMVTGSHHQQVYWVEGPIPNQLDYVGVAWVIADREWRSMMDIFVLPPDRREYLRHWNDHCIHCHATDGVPRPVESGGMWARETSVADFGVACESCHGPGAAHVAARKNDAPPTAGGGASKADPTIVNPARLPGARSSETCALCHAVTHSIDQNRWYREGFVYRPGGDLQRSEVVLRPFDPAHAPYVAERTKDDPEFVRNHWWSDGDVRVSGREYSAMSGSPCDAKGALSCTSCHALHSYEALDDQLKPGMRGDAACTQCHTAPKYVAAEHVRHAPASEGARCQNCHTPNTAYGLLKATRTHRVSSPSVATTIETGRPNACNLCHLDKTLAWTQDILGAWYGTKPIDLPEDRRVYPEGPRGLISGDAGVRALTAWHMAWPPAHAASGVKKWGTPLLLETFVDDGYSAVRYQARKALAALEGGDASFDDLAPAADRELLRAAFLKRREGLEWLEIVPGGIDGRAKLRALRDDRPIVLTE